MVACFERTKENAEFYQIFWKTINSQTVNDVKKIYATVDGKTVVISESSVRSGLHFNDEDGITCLTNTAIFENLALTGYESDSEKLTFQKALFSPQWKYLIHTIQSTSWNEFSTNIASALIYLATGQKFNFSKLIFDELFNDTYETPKHTKKIFTNMKRKGKDFLGRVTPLFASMFAPPVVGGEDEAIFKERDDRVVMATTTAASLDAAQASDRPRCQEDIVGVVAQTRVLELEQLKTTQDLVINKLQKKVKRLEKALRARTQGMKLFKIGTSRRKGLDKENVSKQGRKSDKTKPMFKDSDFDVLDDAIENVKGGSTAEQITTTRDTLNTASIYVSTAELSKTDLT
ncbi:hypothetical protein Tco_0243181 [Tanacetum coccineum]